MVHDPQPRVARGVLPQVQQLDGRPSQANRRGCQLRSTDTPGVMLTSACCTLNLVMLRLLSEVRMHMCGVTDERGQAIYV